MQLIGIYLLRFMSSNRTFMELKLNTKRAIVLGDSCSNRTFMELKYKYRLIIVVLRLVLIVPLWN